MTKIKKITGYPVICQLWEESEMGWGQSPDGFSLHLTIADRDAFIKAYKKDRKGSTPSIYDRPCGEPYQQLVSQKVADLIGSGNGIRSSEDYPNRNEVLESI